MVKKENLDKVEFSTPEVDFFDFRVFRHFDHDPMDFPEFFSRIGSAISVYLYNSNWVEIRPFSMRKLSLFEKIIFRIIFFEILGQFLKIHIFSIKSLETTYFGVFSYAEYEFNKILTIPIFRYRRLINYK